MDIKKEILQIQKELDLKNSVMARLTGMKTHQEYAAVKNGVKYRHFNEDHLINLKSNLKKIILNFL